jgi:nucleoid-associated protein YgaU
MPLQPVAGGVAFRDANAAADNAGAADNTLPTSNAIPTNNAAPADNNASAYESNPGYNRAGAYGATPVDNAAPQQFVESGAMQAAGRAAVPGGGYDPPAATGEPGRADPSRVASNTGEPGKYVVQPNDNYWTISEKVYGGGAFFKALQQYNGDGKSQSARLQVGDVVAVPPTAVLRQKFPELCPKPRREQAASQMQPVSAGPRQRLGAPVYVVEQGDSLFDIARSQLGKASRWVEIYDLNRDALGDDFHYLRPGAELVMPNSGSSKGQPTQDVMTRQRGDSIQR